MVTIDCVFACFHTYLCMRERERESEHKERGEGGCEGYEGMRKEKCRVNSFLQNSRFFFSDESCYYLLVLFVCFLCLCLCLVNLNDNRNNELENNNDNNNDNENDNENEEIVVTSGSCCLGFGWFKKRRRCRYRS